MGGSERSFRGLIIHGGLGTATPWIPRVHRTDHSFLYPPNDRSHSVCNKKMLRLCFVILGPSPIAARLGQVLFRGLWEKWSGFRCQNHAPHAEFCQEAGQHLWSRPGKRLQCLDHVLQCCFRVPSQESSGNCSGSSLSETERTVHNRWVLSKFAFCPSCHGSSGAPETGVLWPSQYTVGLVEGITWI